MNTESIIRLVELCASGHGWSGATASTYAAGSGDFLGRLKRGHDITTRRAIRVTQWLSDHWPEGAEWPSDIPRPAPKQAQDRAA